MENGEISELIKALCKAKKEFKPITKEGSNPFLNTKYIKLDTIVNATDEALSNNGLVIIHHEELEGENQVLITELIHESGQCKPTKSIMNEYLSAEKNDKGNYKVTPLQIKGSVISYLRRYHIGELLGIVVDEDKDGNAEGSKDKSKESGKSEFPKTIEEIKNLISGIDNLPYMKNWTAKHGKEINDLPEKAEIWALVSAKEKELAGKKNPPKEEPQNSNGDFLSVLKSDLEKITTIEKINELYDKNKPGYERNPKFDEIKEIFIARKRDLANALMAKNMGIELADLVEFRKEMNGHGIDNTLIQQVIDGTKEDVNELKIRIENWKKDKAKKGDQLDMLGHGKKQHNDPM